MFKKKNIYLYGLLYSIITICLSIFHFINGTTYDGLGYYHELYRAIALFAFMAFIYAIRHFNFNKLIDSIISFWPLFLGLLLLLALRYKEGGINFNTLKKWLLYLLLGLLGFLLAVALISTISKYIKDSLKGRKKLYFSFGGCILVALLVLPFIFWHLFNGNRTVINLIGSQWYLYSLIPLTVIVFFFLLSRKYDNHISPLIYGLTGLYYILWLVAYISPINIYLVQAVQIVLNIILLLYAINNSISNSLIFIVIFFIAIFIGALLFFA